MQPIGPTYRKLRNSTPNLLCELRNCLPQKAQDWPGETNRSNRSKGAPREYAFWWLLQYLSVIYFVIFSNSYSSKSPIRHVTLLLFLVMDSSYDEFEINKSSLLIPKHLWGNTHQTVIASEIMYRLLSTSVPNPPLNIVWRPGKFRVHQSTMKLLVESSLDYRKFIHDWTWILLLIDIWTAAIHHRCR
jgi:hypothetical protein